MRTEDETDPLLSVRPYAQKKYEVSNQHAKSRVLSQYRSLKLEKHKVLGKCLEQLK